MGRSWLYRLYDNRKCLIFAVLYALISVYALAHFVSSSYLGDRYDSTAFNAMIDGTAKKPFVYRVLMPTLTRAVVDSTPKSWKEAINYEVQSWVASPKTSYTRQTMPWLVYTYDVRDPYPRLVCTFLIYLALIGYAVVLYRLAAVLVPGDEPLRRFAPIFGMLAISAFSKPWQYIYDIPVLFLSASCFYFLYISRIKPYLVCFVLACLNRETSIFILLFFAIWSYGRMPRTSFIALCAVQAVLYVFIKIALTYAYMDNSGDFLEYNLSRVLRLDIFERADHMRIFVVCGLFFLLTYRWKDKPLFLRTGLFVLPVMYVGYFFYGNGGEYRVFFDIMPLLVLLTTHTLTEAAGFRGLPFFSPDTNSGDT